MLAPNVIADIDSHFILRKRPQDTQSHNLLCDQRGWGALPPTSKRPVSVEAEVGLLALWVPQSIACYNYLELGIIAVIPQI